MTIRDLIKLTRCARSPIHDFASRSSLSTAVAASLPSPPPPPVMIYDRLDESVKRKLKRLEELEPRFLQHNSPHPTVVAFHADVLSPLTRVTTLPNGLRIAAEPNVALKTATVGVFIDAGSRFESKESYGTAHFLEHMIFKGTEKRNARELEEEIENISGHLNAYTSREQTTYYAKVMDKDVSHALDTLSDILQNSKFDENQIMRDVILREMEEVEGQAEEIIFDHLHATAFQYTPLSRTILGPAENIKAIGGEHLQRYIASHYTAPRMVMTAAGAVKHEDIVEQVRKLFTKLSTNFTLTSELIAKVAAFTGSEIRMLDDDVPLAQFAVAFEGASWMDPDSIALMVM